MLPSKWENLSRSTKLVHVCKKLPLALDCRHSKYSQQIYSIHIFSILGVACPPVRVRIWFSSGAVFLEPLYMSSKSVSQIFKIYFKLEILIFLSLMVSFLVDMFNLSSLSNEKTSAVRSETHFSKESTKN